MCGFAGFWQAEGIRVQDAVMALRRMTDSIRHRGPDDDGEFVEPTAGVALGFRRLAILDLTPLGHQPMASPSQRFHMVFNGEIYNHHELRRELAATGVRFAGRSDTEALVAGFDVWGIDVTLRKAAGMFAIAVWDATERRLTLARDRIGIKPLYVYHEAGYISFGSELKALANGPKFQRRLNEQAALEYASLLYVPGPRTILQHVSKLPAGTLLEVEDPWLPLPPSRAYWSLVHVARAGRLGGHTLPEAEAPAAIEHALTEAVRSHLESDVPLGAFLSGGIDSTTVVSLMRRESARPVRTFTVQFDDPVHDEAQHAEAIAAHLGTEHTTIPVNGDAALELIPGLADVYDEPFADASQLPTLLVSAAARRHVTVVLTGDGGDELFAGYNRYLYGQRVLERLDRVPRPIRLALSRLVELVPGGMIDRAVGFGARVAGGARERLVEEKARKLGRLLALDSPVARYQRLVSTGLALNSASPAPPALAIGQAFGDVGAAGTLLDRMLLADQLSYLPDNQMTKVDRASMAVGLEARVPLLDHRLVELAWRLPSSWLTRHGVGKWALRHVAYQHVPRALLDRPKTGFSVPLARWLRGPLQGWVEEMLRPEQLAHGPLPAVEVSAAWRRLRQGHDEAANSVWASVVFEAWRRRWLS